jgi:hypothetical protein
MTEQNRNKTQSKNFNHVGAYSSLYTICQVGIFLNQLLIDKPFFYYAISVLDSWIITYIFCILLDSQFPRRIWVY